MNAIPYCYSSLLMMPIIGSPVCELLALLYVKLDDNIFHDPLEGEWLCTLVLHFTYAE